mgnify:CR=1
MEVSPEVPQATRTKEVTAIIAVTTVPGWFIGRCLQHRWSEHLRTRDSGADLAAAITTIVQEGNWSCRRVLAEQARGRPEPAARADRSENVEAWLITLRTQHASPQSVTAASNRLASDISDAAKLGDLAGVSVDADG